MHRFLNKRAGNILTVAAHTVEGYDGDAAGLVGNGGADLDTVEERPQELPGFGSAKAPKIKHVLHDFGHRNFSDTG